MYIARLTDLSSMSRIPLIFNDGLCLKLEFGKSFWFLEGFIYWDLFQQRFSLISKHGLSISGRIVILLFILVKLLVVC